VKRLLLIGAGHTHLEVLRRVARAAWRGVDIVVVDPQRFTVYSGMLPGIVAGHYAMRDARIDAASIAAGAGARFVHGAAGALDLANRRATVDSGEAIGFDIVSIDIGSALEAPVDGADARTIAVKPVAAFIDAWQATREGAAAGRIASIAVVGAGAGGIETLLAMQYALRATRAIAWHLIADTPSVLPQHAAAARARLERVLARRAVRVHAGVAATGVDDAGVRLADATLVAADRVVWTTGARAHRWPRDAGLRSDEGGFIAVDDALRSISHPFVFAAGDCATQVAHRRPKSGVFAVRQGAPLARNLLRALRGAAPRPFVPQRTALALISTGDRCAVAAYGRVAIGGAWVWRWKDAIDRGFIAGYRTIERRVSVAAAIE
jgi:selenide,water dikinase